MSLDRLAVAANRRTGIVNPEEQGHSFIDHESPHSRMVRKEQRALIAQCIAQLPERQQTVFRLREVDEMSYQQIAATLEISEDLVKVSLFRARKKMQELLIEQEMIDGHPLHTEAEKGNGTITGHQ
jgi:RNA polymerase sigma-70 factor (ECF subfamily)